MNQKNSENMQKFPTNHNVTHNVVRRIFTNGEVDCLFTLCQ